MSLALGIETISLPKLQPSKGDSVVKICREYKQYMHQVMKLNEEIAQHKRITLVGYKTCLSAALLILHTELGEFEGTTNIAEVMEKSDIPLQKDRTLIN